MGAAEGRIMKPRKSLCGLVLVLGATGGCDDATKKGSETQGQVIAAWKAAELGPVELAKSEETIGIAGGECREGTVAGLHVDLCTYKDALTAASAQEKGLSIIGENTGAALVRDRYLLVVADVDKVDVHGKVLNKVAKIFLEPPATSTMAAKLQGEY